MNTEVIIVGKGISGLILSSLLAKKGIDHVILSRNDNRKDFALSETLPPSTLPLLASLNLLALFEENASKSFGYHSIWGTDRITDNNFFFHHPYKYGLKIDKKRLMNRLAEKVSDKIIDFNFLSKLEQKEHGIIVEILNENETLTVNGKVIVDATGRNRAVLKKLGISVKAYDQLIASICHVPVVKHSKIKHKVIVESFKEGWGIVSSLNEQTNVISIFTNKNNAVLRELKDYQNWKSVLSETSILKDLLSSGTDCKVMGWDANSAKSVKVAGDNWLAIGDAAISFDPLSSHGISNAVYCANAASKAISAHLEGNALTSFKTYDQNISQIFDEYLKHKSMLYRAEKRWKESGFWKKIQ